MEGVGNFAPADSLTSCRNEKVASATVHVAPVFGEAVRSAMEYPSVLATRTEVIAVSHKSDEGIASAFSLSHTVDARPMRGEMKSREDE